MASRGKVIVLGAGAQGVCVALALAGEGYAVTIVDAAAACMTRASLRNEGKIHLGFVYANDAIERTPLLMLRSALVFAGLIERWTGGAVDWANMLSRPFVYGITNDSMVPRTRLLAAYGELQRHYERLRAEDPSLAYFGARPDALYDARDTGGAERYVKPEFASSFVATREVALDLPKFRGLLDRALGARTGIRTQYGRRVESVERTAGGLRVRGVDVDGAPWSEVAERVVNCLWEGRLAVDATLGIEPSRSWVYRLKYRILGEVPESLRGAPSMTYVLGPYGDLVMTDGAPSYLSWYPEVMQGWCKALAPPGSWEPAANGIVDREFAGALARRALTAYERIVPGIGGTRVTQVDAGIIFSWGSTDIDDAASELHARYEIGVSAHDGYFSIDTGKLTCAPYFAARLLESLR